MKKLIHPALAFTLSVTSLLAQAPTPSAPPVNVNTTLDAAKSGVTPDSGTWLKDKSINDIFTILAKRAGYQYFSNPSLGGLTITGHLNDDTDPLEQIRAIGMQYGITLHTHNKTIYALDEKQASKLPKVEFVYPLKYLRSDTDKEQERLLDLLKPLVSPEGSLRFEPKTSTIVAYDHEMNIELIKSRLCKVDVAKGQVIVDVKILRISNERSNRYGFDWSNTLGKQGLNLSASATGKINDLFAATSIGAAAAAVDAAASGSGGVTGAVTNATSGVVISPITVTAVLRALNDANLAKTENGPVIIAEDNETAVFNIVDRIPIIEQTVTTSNGVNNISTDVRYKIGKDDNNEDPKKSREIGVSITVTPTLLPDGTIRMKLFPRVATVTGYVQVQTGVSGVTNQVPNVSEAKAESTARIPNGYSLLLGGYYQSDERSIDSKVPFLGDLPLISFMFKSKQREKTRANIAFLITPTSYDPLSAYETVAQSERIRQNQTRPKSLDYPDDENPSENEKPSLGMRIRNLIPFGKPTPKPHPLLPTENPGPVIKTKQQQDQERIQQKLKGQQ